MPNFDGPICRDTSKKRFAPTGPVNTKARYYPIAFMKVTCQKDEKEYSKR